MRGLLKGKGVKTRDGIVGEGIDVGLEMCHAMKRKFVVGQSSCADQSHK